MTILERGAQKISQEIQAAPKIDEEKNLATLLTYQEMTNQGAQRDIVDQSVQALVSKVATSSYIPPQLGIVMKRGTWDSEKFGRYIPAFFGVQPVWEKVKDIGRNIYGPTGSQKDFVSLTAMKELGADLGPATDAYQNTADFAEQAVNLIANYDRDQVVEKLAGEFGASTPELERAIKEAYQLSFSDDLLKAELGAMSHAKILKLVSSSEVQQVLGDFANTKFPDAVPQQDDDRVFAARAIGAHALAEKGLEEVLKAPLDKKRLVELLQVL